LNPVEISYKPEHMFVGIDLGTSGVRSCAITEKGDVVATVAVDLADAKPSNSSTGHIHEQRPETWWAAVCRACKQLTQTIRKNGLDLTRIRTVCVDGTSGTLVALNHDGKPVRNAIMYNDPRGGENAAHLNQIASDHCRNHGYRFASSFAIAKILWLREHEPRSFEQTAFFVHQADFIVQRLSDCAGITDYSNALKTGYDLLSNRWPDWLERFKDVSSRLPKVVAPGTPIGNISPQASELTGLPTSTAVVTGATDGVAACLASGASHEGDTNVTLGTTLVFKRVSRQIVTREDGLIYSHKLPDGYWLPGAASNTGAEWTSQWFPNTDYREMDARALEHLPCPLLAYPLARKGERFPFHFEAAEGFLATELQDSVQRYAACLQGTALLERLALDLLDASTLKRGESVFSTGTPSKSDIWMQLRADICQKMYLRPLYPESCFGSALLGAKSLMGSLADTIQLLVHIDKTFEPQKQNSPFYEELYERFLNELKTRGYL